MKSKLLTSLLALIAGTTVSGNAATIVSTYGTVSGADDNNQAGPLRGVSYEIITTGTYSNNAGTAPNIHALSASDPTATQVQFQSLSWQRSGTASGINATALFVSVFDGLTVDSNGNVTSLGTFMGASTNSVANPGANAQMTWSFNNVLLDNNSTYQFVFTTTASPTLTTDVSFQALELNVPAANAVLTETQVVGGNAASVTNRAAWEPVFSMTYNSIPEPSAALLGAFGVLALLRRRRA